MALLLSSGCSGNPPAGIGPPESRVQAATRVRDRELELTALRAEMAATRIAGAKKEAELQELRDLVQQLRQENGESRQAFLEMRDQAEQRQREFEKARDEHGRHAEAQTSQHLTVLKDTVVTLTQELGQLRQELAKPVIKERVKPPKPAPSKSTDSPHQEPRTDQLQSLPSARRGDGRPPTIMPAVRTIPPQQP